MLWCWLIPLVPFISLWDGIVSCLRQWTEAEWRQGLAGMVDESALRISADPHRMCVIWIAPVDAALEPARAAAARRPLKRDPVSA